jgi:hypothetical protein
MCRMKSTAHRGHMVVASSSSSEDDLSIGADQEEALAPTCDVASSSAVSQHRGGMPLQRKPHTPAARFGLLHMRNRWYD